ncbi:hypothetical protein WJX73_006328 [Symbiochloris irregularis]|uniref:Carboxymuconolactone decarboxylase-like domain-containing protein n=1 Tax=Symbiochloris irregularis TaxID=706552 RepID=A0AAW1PKA7_9CHLO
MHSLIWARPSLQGAVCSTSLARTILQPWQRAEQGTMRTNSSTSAADQTNAYPQNLTQQDEQLLRVFLTACHYRWKELPVRAQAALDAGCTSAQLRATVRHLPIVAGYAPCLAAAKALHASGHLGEDTPGKMGGPPGNAFELVYAKVRDRVWQNLYQVDSYISEAIRIHAYGDIYSSPGLNLQQKQIFIIGFLGTADMHDELFGHCLAALRFGVPQAACEYTIRTAFQMDPSKPEALQRRAVKILAGASRKVKQNFPDGLPPLPSVTIPDPESVRRSSPPPEANLDGAGHLVQDDSEDRPS